MIPLYVLMPGEVSSQLWQMAGAAIGNRPYHLIREAKELPIMKDKKIVLAVELNEAGYNLSLFEMLTTLYQRGKDALAGSQGILLIHSPHELFTKSMAQDILFRMNQLGCGFPGHPVVEATGELYNFRTWQKNLGGDLEEACRALCHKLGDKFLEEEPQVVEKPRILALHASSHSTSNTLMLWRMVQEHLKDQEIQELHVENGTIIDCKGCSYTTCKHFSKRNACFYGGAIVQEILPAIEKAHAVVWICPNYNDAVSAKLTAVINRMTALYRRTKLYDKTLYAVIVSGNSGSDSVAKQLIGALTINKSFRLPPYFSILATANDPGEIYKVKDIQEKARDFAQNLLREIKA